MYMYIYVLYYCVSLNSVELKNWFRILSAVAVMMKVVTVILYIIQGAYTAENSEFLSLNYSIVCIHMYNGVYMYM